MFIASITKQLRLFTLIWCVLYIFAQSSVIWRVDGSKMTNFSQNLRTLCKTQPSVSKICREIGLNRQQFERYLQGSSVPSSHNTFRIGQYFGIDEQSLFQSPDQFSAARAAMPNDLSSSSLFNDLFPGNLAVLRNYIGLYHTHFVNMTWPTFVQRGLCLVTEENSKIVTHYIGRVTDPKSNQIFRSRFRGMLSMQGDQLFLLERGSRSSDALAQTILLPPERHSSAYISGLTFAMAWRPHRAPFSSRTIWKRLQNRFDYRTPISQCGLIEAGSRSLDPVIRSFFADNTRNFLEL